MTILVVDDEISYRLALNASLTDQGHKIVMAEDGEQALAKLQNHQIDLVISDIYMPVMDGFKLHKAIRASERWRSLPILFVSAYDDEDTVKVIDNPKVEAFLRKGRPLSEIREWSAYLTAPEDQKTARFPGSRLGKRGL